MQSSLWATTLDSFQAELAGPRSSPAAGGAAAVSARLAVSLLIKVLAIAKMRTTEAGVNREIDELIQAASLEADVLAAAADEDGAAFASYLTAVRQKAGETTIDSAMSVAIEIPLRAAHSAVRALVVSGQAVAAIPVFLAADLGAAVFLLGGAVRALLMTVEYNLKRLSAPAAELAERKARIEAQCESEISSIFRHLQIT